MQRFLRIGTLIFTTLAVVGCGGDDGAPSAPTNATKAEGVEQPKAEKIKVGRNRSAGTANVSEQ